MAHRKLAQLVEMKLPIRSKACDHATTCESCLMEQTWINGEARLLLGWAESADLLADQAEIEKNPKRQATLLAGVRGFLYAIRTLTDMDLVGETIRGDD